MVGATARVALTPPEHCTARTTLASPLPCLNTARLLNAACHSWNSNQLRSLIGMLHCIIERTRTYYHVAIAEGHGKAVQASRSRSIKVLSINIIVRTMAWALEAIAVIAEWNRTAQVNTTLVQRNPVGSVAIFDKVLRV